MPVSAAFVGYNLLLIGFGIGLWLDFRRRSRWMQLAAVAILCNGGFGLVIELAPMDPLGPPSPSPAPSHGHRRPPRPQLHRRDAFSLYGWGDRATTPIIAGTWFLLLVMLLTGTLAALAAAQAWPLLGLLQRFTIGSYLLWLFALALILLRGERVAA